MLEQLHDIRWNTLRDAHGSAQPVPRLLRALAQPDLQTREDALVMWANDVDSPGYAERLAAIERIIPGTTVVEGGWL